MEPTQVHPLTELKHAQEQLQFYRGMLFLAGEISRGARLDEMLRIAEAGMAREFQRVEEIKRRVYGGK